MSRVHTPSNIEEFPVNYVLREYGGEIGAAAMAFSRTVYEETELSLREMEAARVRTALINGCMICKQARAARDFDTQLPTSDAPFKRAMTSRGLAPDDQFYEQIGSWQNATIYSPRERLAIEYAERLGERPQSMGDDEPFWAAMHTHFSDREIVDLSFSIASWMGVGRVIHALELDTVCMAVPESLVA
jgi:alkylhydroperoxidase family enzyme